MDPICEDIPMWTRLMPALVLMLLVMANSARAQNTTQPAGPAAEEQAARQQMRDTFQSIIQNMIAKGIDPRTFFQQIQDGADPLDIQKQLLSQGLIDQKTLDQLQSNMLAVTASRIKSQLGVSDLEWQALWPLVQKVITAASALNGTRRGGGGMTRFFTAQTPAGADLTKATNALTAAANDPSATPDVLAIRLQKFRDAKAKAQQDLDAARRDLQSVLTIRQEGVLTSMGILE
jgi:hypothetical protein